MNNHFIQNQIRDESLPYVISTSVLCLPATSGNIFNCCPSTPLSPIYPSSPRHSSIDLLFASRIYPSIQVSPNQTTLLANPAPSFHVSRLSVSQPWPFTIYPTSIHRYFTTSTHSHPPPIHSIYKSVRHNLVSTQLKASLLSNQVHQTTQERK